MGTANQQPSSALTGLLGDFGIDLETLSGGSYADPKDLEVIVGPSTRDLRQEYLTAGVAEADIPTPLPDLPPDIKRISELEKDFYAMDPQDLAALQHRLWAGGFYPQGADPEEIALGDYDEYTFSAWQKALTRAGRFKQAGQEYTLDEVIDMAANLEGADAARGNRAGGGGGRRPLTVELTNPEDLRYYAQKTAVSTLGRSLRPEELERFVSSFHGSQRTAQTQAHGAAEGGGTSVAAPSPVAAAEAFARREAPTEAGAHDFVKVYDVVSRLLGGRRGR